jgi:glycosyltransferase involved in cell wall biosynthesis
LNILFVHEIDWSTKVVFDLHSLSELLSNFGHNVFIIDFKILSNKKIDFSSLKTEESILAGRAHSDALITLIRPGSIKAPFFDRASAFLTHYLAIENSIKANKIDVIVLYSVPTNGYQIINLAHKYGIPVVFRSIDILHKLVPSKVYGPVTFSLETWVYKHSDKILTLSPMLSDYVIRMGANKNNVELLLFGVDLNKFNPSIQSSIVKKSLGLSETDLVVLYIGTLFDFSGLDLYLEQFPQVIKNIPNTKLLIVGGGALYGKLKKSISELELTENVILTGFKPFSTMPQFINMASICINPFKVTGATREIIPGKVIQYLACGKPVLSTPLPGMISFLKGTDYGLVYSDIQGFAENTIRLLKDIKTREQIGKNGYQYAKNNHDEVKLAHKLEHVLSQKIQELKCQELPVPMNMAKGKDSP